MKFINVVAFLAVAIGVTSAALPVEPMNAFVLQDQNQQQHIIEERKPALPNTFKSYIVVFKDTAAAQVIEKAEKEILSFGGKIGQRYSAALKGFSALIPGPIVTALSTNPFIDYIEEDGEVAAYQ